MDVAQAFAVQRVVERVRKNRFDYFTDDELVALIRCGDAELALLIRPLSSHEAPPRRRRRPRRLSFDRADLPLSRF